MAPQPLSVDRCMCSRTDPPSVHESIGAVMTHAVRLEKKNRLAKEKSPYLLQHAGNPVDWFPWGDEAFEAARRAGKPIFLSIGYATCHWCHVMEHESFEDPEVAALMNETFVNIKVDREERPDIDQVYMTVCQMMTGSGGWPLTVLMTPDKKPFFAGTYFPRETRHGRIGMLELAPRIGRLWADERDKVSGSAEQITARLEAVAGGRSAGAVDRTLPDRAVRELAGRYDAVHGGFNSAPKFPSPHNLTLLARYAALEDEPKTLEMVDHTLERMHRGGIFDQVGHGFHRYSTDVRWLLPHFEKMLYDQALLVFASVEASLAGGQADHRRTAEETITYVLRDMTSPDGAFFSAEDADSEGEEGRFYVWTADELEAVLGPDDAAVARGVWNVAADGNFADEATGETSGVNILHRTESEAELAERLGVDVDVFRDRIESIRKRLFANREQRVHPLKDDKVLADWNGLMAAALARAGRVFDRPEWVDAAGRAVDFAVTRMRDADRRLHHRWRDGELSIPGFLDDHAFLIGALLELYDATLDSRHLERAVELQAAADSLFWDAEHGGCFFAAADNEPLLVRQKEIYDGAIPSGNSATAANLLRLARLTGNTDHAERADRIFAAFASDTARGASAHSHLADAMLLARTPSMEIVIAGEPEASDTAALLEVIRSRYLPQATVLLVSPGPEGDRIRRLAPFTEGHMLVDGRAAAYVCRDFACRQPVTEPAELARLLDGDEGPGA